MRFFYYRVNLRASNLMNSKSPYLNMAWCTVNGPIEKKKCNRLQSVEAKCTSSLKLLKKYTRKYVE